MDLHGTRLQLLSQLIRLLCTTPFSCPIVIHANGNVTHSSCGPVRFRKPMTVNICGKIFGAFLKVPSKNHVEFPQRISIFLGVAKTKTLGHSGQSSSSCDSSESSETQKEASSLASQAFLGLIETL